MVKILIDATCVENIHCGYRIYAENLLFHLLPLLQGHQVEILLQEELSPESFLRQNLKKHPEVKISLISVPVLGPKRDWWGFSRGPQEFDIYHCLHSNPLLLKNTWMVATLHDLTALRVDDYFAQGKIWKRAYLKYNYRWLLQRCHKIIAVSHSTAKDAKELLSLPSEKICVIHEAAQPFQVSNKNESIPWGNKKFFLTIGTRPHKNLRRLLLAFQDFRSKYPNFSLVVVGEKPNYLRQKENTDLFSEVHFCSGLSEGQLSLYYQSCWAFLYVSLYEGFGLPLLEAMERGAAVISSQTSSLPEVAGEAAILVDPYSTIEITQAMETILSQDWREHLIKKGYEQAQRFTWEKTAQETLRVYQECPAFKKEN